MPTPAKEEQIADLSDRIGRAVIAIATDFSGLKVNDLTELRRRLREQGVEYRVVKNRLAARAAGTPETEIYRDLLEGSTALAFGYDDPIAPAKVIDTFIKETRSALKVRNAVMDGKLLSDTQVAALASIPPKDELLAKLLGQMNAPITGLVTVLAGPVRALATVLQRRAEQLG